MTQSLSAEHSSSVDNFFTGDKPVDTKQVTVKVGQVIPAHEVMAIETASGKYVTYDEGGSGGTNVAAAIAAYDIDTTGAEDAAQVYREGSFNPELVTFSGTPTAVQIANMFVDSPIVLQKPQG